MGQFAAGLLANIAEYAVMHGMPFDEAMEYARRGRYFEILRDIRRGAK